VHRPHVRLDVDAFVALAVDISVSSPVDRLERFLEEVLGGGRIRPQQRFRNALVWPPTCLP
jgi:hypothetical protein